MYKNYRAGIGNVGSYQVAGRPFITGSSELKDSEEHKIAFPSVARSFTVINRATPDIRVHFHSTSSYSTVIDDKHYITLDSTNTSVTMNVKCKEIYITRDPSIEASTDAQYEIFAELTQIAVEEMPDFSGSGLTD